jgi:hypothetical protein
MSSTSGDVVEIRAHDDDDDDDDERVDRGGAVRDGKAKARVVSVELHARTHRLPARPVWLLHVSVPAERQEVSNCRNLVPRPRQLSS